MEKYYPSFRNDRDTSILKFLPDSVLELALSNIYLLVEGQVESFIKKFFRLKIKIFF